MNVSKNKAETSSAKFEDLKSRANESYKRNELHKSVQLYNQVLLVDNLSSEQKAIVHSNRSLVYLKLYEAINRRDREFLFKSLVDAEQANALNPKWCKTWARLGQIYAEFNEYEKCIHNYTKALELEPANEHVKNLLAQAKTSNFEQKRLAHFDDSYAPKTTEQRTQEELKKFADRLGQDNTDQFEQTFERTKQDLIKSDTSLEYVWLGHEHRDGSSTCKQSYELAAKYYAKAAKMDNAEAMYNLALMHKQGNGVKLDFELAISLFEQAASQSAFKKLFGYVDAPNVGVAESEHMLGLLYHQGIYVAKNIEQAVKYYERAVEHGSPHAANNLGLIFMNADGVAMDLERAQVLFLYSQKKGSLEAITNLVYVYLAKGDPEQALLWHERDLQASPILATQRHEQIMMEISDLRARKGQFDKGLVETLINLKCNPNELNEDPCYPHSIRSQAYDEKMLAQKAQRGSATAKNMLDAMRLFNQALDQFSQNKPSNLASVICKMAEALQIESLVCLRPVDVQYKLLEQLEKVVDENLGKKRCELDLNARICLMYFNMSNYAQNLQFINKSIEKYADCTRMYELKASMHIFLKQFKMGIKQYDYVLSKEPQNSLSTYLRAAALKNSSCFKDALKDYERFLSICPSDARKVPEAYYSIGFCKLVLNKDKSQAGRIVEQYFKKGELAEKDQLPCFLPYDSQTKTKLQNCLAIMDLNNNLTGTKAVRNEHRTNLIRKHRQMIYEMQTKFLNSNYNTVLTSFKAPKTQKQPHSMAILKEIQLKEIDFTKDEVLTGRVLTVRVFDLPSFGFTSIFFLIDDGGNTMQRLSVYNLGKDYEQISVDFKVGTWISIMNPYVRQAMDGEAMIRVDDPKSIVFSGKTSEKVCSYCSKSNSKFSCSKCLKVSYCDKECQTKDWKEQNHKLVCFKS